MERTLATLPAQDELLPAGAGAGLDVEDVPEEPLASDEEDFDELSELPEDAGMELDPLPAPARESVR